MTFGELRLDGKQVIVTGASSGIGRRIATACVERGASVHAVARRSDQLAILADQHPGITPWTTDLLDEAQCERLVDDVVAASGPVDVLVNNAGASNITRAQDETTSDFRRIVDLNLTAPFILARDVGRSMIASGTGGVIVNIASVAGVVGVGRPLPQVSYAASKAGCIQLSRELAVQWARHRIRVNALVPGWVDTEMTSKWLATDQGSHVVAGTVPLGRAAHVDEIASAALFLASDASSYITGSLLIVDGGWTAH